MSFSKQIMLMYFQGVFMFWGILFAVIPVKISQTQAAGASSHWTYAGPHGQEHWASVYPNCGGTAQSPINIETRHVKYDSLLRPVEPEKYGNPESDPFTLLNNGHTVEMALPISMWLQGLPARYTAVQLHLHWGSEGYPGGSEHLLDGEVFPAEMHVVHYNSEKYSNISAAKDKPDGLAVLGILLEAGDTVNAAYEHIFRYLGNVKYAGEKVVVPPFDVRTLLPPRLDHYYRYNGSLTTPPCYQSVLWTVFKQQVQISWTQLDKLQRALFSTDTEKYPAIPLVDNFRAPQPLNHRTVYASFPLGSTSAYSTGEIIAIVFGLLFGTFGLIMASFFIVRRLQTKRSKEQKEVSYKTACSPEETVQ
ncbi:carbonic anhydrase 14 isoform X2 [Latimeria chalumnae]|uniref:carbonic anhydrase 14 isoform X2 n=1 Tax=Latimeria chalumnae TaxID=7897 RepID=UPI0006D935E3|nr:PREDICTED: carbonic anhydrase 14 isoform X2 [Latimeria chalumnae]|eukprot:XP_014349602.1 PREDICTED: carbonic anhydrase 14 isoform X2 [Latimeria chalumnae]